ncbi:MAG: hypothetical protein AAB727_03820 [Patescibacteria group bacterium]
MTSKKTSPQKPNPKGKGKKGASGKDTKDDTLDISGLVDTASSERAKKLAEKYKQKGGE